MYLRIRMVETRLRHAINKANCHIIILMESKSFPYFCLWHHELMYFCIKWTSGKVKGWYRKLYFYHAWCMIELIDRLWCMQFFTFFHKLYKINFLAYCMFTWKVFHTFNMISCIIFKSERMLPKKSESVVWHSQRKTVIDDQNQGTKKLSWAQRWLKYQLRHLFEIIYFTIRIQICMLEGALASRGSRDYFSVSSCNRFFG